MCGCVAQLFANTQYLYIKCAQETEYICLTKMYKKRKIIANSFQPRIKMNRIKQTNNTMCVFQHFGLVLVNKTVFCLKHSTVGTEMYCGVISCVAASAQKPTLCIAAQTYTFLCTQSLQKHASASTSSLHFNSPSDILI